MSISDIAAQPAGSARRLWQHADFRKMLAGEAISDLGSQVGELALPLAAALVLNATPGQIAALRAAIWPRIVVGLVAGVWVDRLRRRPLLIATNIARAALLLGVTATAAVGLLRIELLYVAGVLMAALGVVFGITLQAYLPSLVPARWLVAANSVRATMSRSGQRAQWLAQVNLDSISDVPSRRLTDGAAALDGTPRGTRPTMRHIAELVGVSQSTVSRVLSSAATNVPVAAATRERIRQVVAELGYTPNLMARALSTARSGLIGVIVRDINDPFFATGIAAITREARTHGYSVVLGHVESRAEEAVALTEVLAMGHCDGVILFGDVRGQAKLWPPGAARLPQVGLWLGGGTSEMPVVNVNNRAGVMLAVDHLTALGHSRIAFLQGGRTADGVERRAAFIAALRERGIEHPERAVHVSSNDFLSTARAAEALLQRSDRPSAIVASTDVAAIGAIKGAARLGLRVPEDVSIVGFDDIAMAEVTIPSLTTVQQPVAQLTRLAIERLLSLMANPLDRDADVRLVLPKLVVRESTAPPAGS